MQEAARKSSSGFKFPMIKIYAFYISSEKLISDSLKDKTLVAFILADDHFETNMYRVTLKKAANAVASLLQTDFKQIVLYKMVEIILQCGRVNLN